MNTATKTNIKKSKIKLLHQYYGYTGFYAFVGNSLKKSIIPIALFILSIFLIDRFIIDFNEVFTLLIETHSPIKILTVFFASESMLGLVPPEIFIAWAGKSTSPILFLSLLALLSYLGGIISFFIGKTIAKIPSVYNYLEIKMKKQLINIRKWGGFLIVVGALLPIPFAITSIAAGIIDYKFKNYLLFGLLRFVRFYLYALVIFHVI
ncbi:MAG: short-chain dehydrogenase [Flavobacteriaceae bacterium]|nr:short-chain dehydrogenase [Flavobacteriaceae bacterium]